VLETLRKEEENTPKRLRSLQPNFSSVWHTGLSGGGPDSVRCARLVSDESAALGNRQRRTAKNHRTVRWCTGLSGEPTVASANGRPRNLRATCGRANGRLGTPDFPVCTGQCPVRQPIPGANGRLLSIWKEIEHRT
jgi:adenylylsulfate kinase-like enzyme